MRAPPGTGPAGAMKKRARESLPALFDLGDNRRDQNRWRMPRPMLLPVLRAVMRSFISIA